MLNTPLTLNKKNNKVADLKFSSENWAITRYEKNQWTRWYRGSGTLLSQTCFFASCPFKHPVLSLSETHTQPPQNIDLIQYDKHSQYSCISSIWKFFHRRRNNIFFCNILHSSTGVKRRGGGKGVEWMVYCHPNTQASPFPRRT